MSRMLSAAVVAVALLVLLPEVAHACPVCFDPREENRLAFLATTAFLTLLPLGMVAGTGLWLRKRARGLEESEGGDGGDAHGAEGADDPARGAGADARRDR